MFENPLSHQCSSFVFSSHSYSLKNGFESTYLGSSKEQQLLHEEGERTH